MISSMCLLIKIVLLLFFLAWSSGSIPIRGSPLWYRVLLRLQSFSFHPGGWGSPETRDHWRNESQDAQTHLWAAHWIRRYVKTLQSSFYFMFISIFSWFGILCCNRNRQHRNTCVVSSCTWGAEDTSGILDLVLTISWADAVWLLCIYVYVFFFQGMYKTIQNSTPWLILAGSGGVADILVTLMDRGCWDADVIQELLLNTFPTGLHSIEIPFWVKLVMNNYNILNT